MSGNMGDRYGRRGSVGELCFGSSSCPNWWWSRIVGDGVSGMSAGVSQTEGVCWGVGVDWNMEYAGVVDGVTRCVVTDV